MTFTADQITDARIILKANGKNYTIVPNSEMTPEQAKDIRIEAAKFTLNFHDIVDVPLEEIKINPTDELFQANFDSAIKSNKDFNWNLSAIEYYVGESKAHKNEPVFIRCVQQKDQSYMWKVIKGILVLAKSLEYIAEPSPSNRTGEFLEQTRYSTKEEALSFVIKYEQLNSK